MQDSGKSTIRPANCLLPASSRSLNRLHRRRMCQPRAPQCPWCRMAFEYCGGCATRVLTVGSILSRVMSEISTMASDLSERQA